VGRAEEHSGDRGGNPPKADAVEPLETDDGVAEQPDASQARLSLELAGAKKALAYMERERTRLSADLADARRDLALWSARARQTAAELQRVLQSRSWRLTRPLRFLGKVARGD